MFDIGFSEILVIAIVALIVIGPERLPKVARTLGHLLGRMQRYVNDVKADISREMELDELRKQQASMQEVVRLMEESVNEQISTTGSELNGIAASATDLRPAPPPHAGEAASVPPATGTPPVAAAGATPQLELGLDGSNQAIRNP